MVAKSTTAEEPLWTDADVARLLRVSKGHVVNLRRDGRAPGAIPVGRSRRWIPAVVREWMKAGCPSKAEFEARQKQAAPKTPPEDGTL